MVTSPSFPASGNCIRHRRPRHLPPGRARRLRLRSAGMAEHVQYDVDGDGIAVITINRPEKRNAMTFAMLGDFIATVRRAGQDDAARVVVVTGSGGSFCAGTDLSDLSSVPGEQRGARGTAEQDDVW